MRWERVEERFRSKKKMNSPHSRYRKYTVELAAIGGVNKVTTLFVLL